MTKTRRPDGAGTKDVLPSGNIRCRVSIDGERVTKIFAPEKESEADNFLRTTQAMLADGTMSTQAPSLADWGKTWLDNLTNRSADDDKSRWRSLIAPAPIVKIKLRDLARPHVVAYVDWLGKQRRLENVEGQGKGKKHSSAKAKGDKPLSPQTKRHGLALLRRCLAAAADRGLITTNPALGVRLPRRDKEALEAQPWAYLEQEEIDRVLLCPLLGETTRLRYQVAIYTGLRQGDLWALAWEKLDLVRGRLDIIVEKTGKPLKAPLLPAALAALKRLHHLAGEPKAGLVFPAPAGGRRGETDDGGWATRKKYGEEVKGHKEIAGITRRVRFHDLRHTTATHLLRGTWGRKWGIEEVKEFLAHSSITVTQRYVHAAGALDDAAAATTSWSRLGHEAAPIWMVSPSVGPVGLEPTTNGLKELPKTEETRVDRYNCDQNLTILAWSVVERAAKGSSNRAELEELAEAVLAVRPFKLAEEVLAGGEWAVQAGLALAGQVLRGAAAAPAEREPRRRGMVG